MQKYQTEDILDTFRKMDFIPTSQTEEAKKLLQEKRSVVIKGNPGEGKTSTALHLIDNNYTDQRVVIIRPKQWEKVDTDWVKVVVLEDIFGQYDLDPDRLQNWIDHYLQMIQKHVDEGKLQVIITIRDDIFSKASSKLKSFKLFRSDRSLTLCSNKLQNADKKSILEKNLKRNDREMTVDKIEQCLANFDSLIGFPQCCFLFAGSEDLFVQGLNFFKSPEKFLVDNIRNLKADGFLSLAFLFCSNEIEEEYLSPSQIKKSKKYLPVLEDLAKYLHISFDESTVISLRESYENYSRLYVKKVSLCQDHSGGEVCKSCIQFSHATVFEAVGKVLGDKYPEIVVKHGNSRYLYSRTYTAKAKDDDSQNVFIPVSVFGLLAERMVHDVVERKGVESVVKHSALKEDQFLKKLKDELYKDNRIRDFLMADPYTEDSDFQNVSEVECSTFLQFVLQSDEDAVKLVYSHFMKFLECIHNDKITDCWQCEQKQTLLELALYYHHFEIADQLITVNAHYTHVSLSFTARHGDCSRVQTILEDLKRRQIFVPEGLEAKQTLYRAYRKENQEVIEILLQEGITLHDGHVVDAVRDGDINVLMKVVEHLKFNANWDLRLGKDLTCEWFPHPDIPDECDNYNKYYNSAPCSLALYLSYCKERFDMADYLLKNEAQVTMDMVLSVSYYSSQKVVARMIQNLKDTGTWDPHYKGASAALEKAYVQKKYDVCDLLIQEGVSLKMNNLPSVVNTFPVSLESIQKVIQHLKDTCSWDPKCNEASQALETAYAKKFFYMHHICDLLIQEGVSLTMNILSKYVSIKSVKKVIQHLKGTNSWDPTCDEASNAFIQAYEEKRYDVCGLLVEEGVSCAIQYLPGVTLQSLDIVKTVVKQLEDTNSWDAKCPDASKALEMAYCSSKYDVCCWLIQEGVSLTMKNLANVSGTDRASLESVKKIIQHLKDTDCWDPKNVHASEALENAYAFNLDVCDLLIHEGVSLTMNTLLKVTKMNVFHLIFSVQKIIKDLEEIDSWDPRCNNASEALEVAFENYENKVFDLLFQKGVSLKMKHLHNMIWRSQDLVKTVNNLKETNNWDAKCDDACEALAKAYGNDQYDVCRLLIQEGVSLTMKNLASVIIKSSFNFNPLNTDRVSLESVKKAIQHLKDTKRWDAKCDGASEALVKAYREELYDVFQLLIQEGVSLTMKNLPGVIGRCLGYSTSHPKCRESFISVQKTIKYLKNTGSWDPKCDDASKALEKAYMGNKYEICDLLIQEGVSLTMKCLSYIALRSIEYVKTAVKQLKDTGRWDAKCGDASETLAKAYGEEKYDVCDMLIQAGITLTMKNLPGVTTFRGSLETVQKAIQHLKKNDSWDPKCDHASKALEEAYGRGQYDVCHLLIKEGVSLTMSNLTRIFSRYSPARETAKKVSLALETAKKVIQHLKDTDSWDPKCDHAFKALEVAYAERLYDVYDLLIHEGVLHH